MKHLFNLKHLPYLAAVFQALQFAHAGSVYFGPFGWVIGGVGGGLANLSIATSASRISDIAKSRKPLAYGLGILMLLISPLAIAPAAYISATAVEWFTLRVTVAIVWAILPDLSIALVGAVAGKSLISHGDENKTAQSAQPVAAVRSAKKKSLSKSLSEIQCRYAGAGCTRTFAKQNAANAHARTCEFKPTISMPIDVSKKEISA